MKALQLILAAFFLFATGVVSGVAGARLREKAAARVLLEKRGGIPPPTWQRMEFLRRVQRDLDLTSEQRERIEGHVKVTQEAVRRVWEPVAPLARAEMDALRERIRGELAPGQQERFDHALAERGRKGGRNSERGSEAEPRHSGLSQGRKGTAPPPPVSGPHPGP